MILPIRASNNHSHERYSETRFPQNFKIKKKKLKYNGIIKEIYGFCPSINNSATFIFRKWKEKLKNKIFSTPQLRT